MLSITKTKILAVGGYDEINFFTALINKLRLKDVQVLNFEGKGNYKSKIRAIKNVPGFKNVTKFALIRDADVNPAISAFDSICSSLQSSNLSVPNNINEFSTSNPSIGIYIMPDNLNVGMLEDLCLKSIENTAIFKCISDFLKCSPYKPSELSKAKVLNYLSTKTPLMNNLGVGALAGHWDLNSDSFEEIVKFMENFK